MKFSNSIKTDVLILGGGLAGLYTALNIHDDIAITIAMKEKLGECNSYLAQGGIAGEMSTDPKVLEKHVEDTLVAVKDCYDLGAIEQLVEGANENLKELINLGVPFDKDESGNILLTREGGHSSRRILHAGGDATGRKIMETLMALIQKKQNVTILENYMVYDFIKKDDVCIGGMLINEKNELINVFAKSTVVATGGIGAVYKDSTNAHGATGDGIAAAFRAGASIRGMEFVQFHPTVFYDKTETIIGQKFLISEAVRGEGAYLLNTKGERFMEKYDSRLELAPRDVVSQAIMKELELTNSKHVYIDARHLGKDFLEFRFPTIYEKCKEFGYLMEKDLVPVAPVEHFGVGGIKVNLSGETTIKGLYANGECCSSGVHGTNRLASNSLLECVVFGKIIAEKINKQKSDIEIIDINKNFIYKETSYHEVRTFIRDTMNKFVFVVRNTKGLEEAKLSIDSIYEELKNNPILSMDYYRTYNIATVAKLITDAAFARKESVGAHLRID